MSKELFLNLMAQAADKYDLANLPANKSQTAVDFSEAAKNNQKKKTLSAQTKLEKFFKANLEGVINEIEAIADAKGCAAFEVKLNKNAFTSGDADAAYSLNVRAVGHVFDYEMEIRVNAKAGVVEPAVSWRNSSKVSAITKNGSINEALGALAKWMHDNDSDAMRQVAGPTKNRRIRELQDAVKEIVSKMPPVAYTGGGDSYAREDDHAKWSRQAEAQRGKAWPFPF